MRVEVAVVGSPSLISLMVFVDVEPRVRRTTFFNLVPDFIVVPQLFKRKTKSMVQAQTGLVSDMMICRASGGMPSSACPATGHAEANRTKRLKDWPRRHYNTAMPAPSTTCSATTTHVLTVPNCHIYIYIQTN